MEYVSLTLIFLSSLFAIRGDTWDSTKVGLSKVTPTGWLTALIALTAFGVSINLSAINNKSAEELSQHARDADMTINALKSQLAQYQKVIDTIENRTERAEQLVNDSAVDLAPGKRWHANDYIYPGSIVRIWFAYGDKIKLVYGKETGFMNGGNEQVIDLKPVNGEHAEAVIMGHSGEPMDWELINTGRGNFGGKVMVYSTPRSRSTDWSWVEEEIKPFGADQKTANAIQAGDGQ